MSENQRNQCHSPYLDYAIFRPSKMKHVLASHTFLLDDGIFWFRPYSKNRFANITGKITGFLNSMSDNFVYLVSLGQISN